MIFSEPEVVQQLINEGTAIINEKQIKFIKLNFQELIKNPRSKRTLKIKNKFKKAIENDSKEQSTCKFPQNIVFKFKISFF